MILRECVSKKKVLPILFGVLCVCVCVCVWFLCVCVFSRGFPQKSFQVFQLPERVDPCWILPPQNRYLFVFSFFQFFNFFFLSIVSFVQFQFDVVLPSLPWSWAGMSTAPGSGAPPPPQQQQLLPKPKPTFRDALTAFYAKFNPAKLSEVPSLVQKYKGRETATIQALRVKYNVSEQALRELVAGHQRRKLQAAAARPRQQQQQQPQHQHQQQQLPRHPYQQSPTRSVTSPGVGKESGPSPESQQQLARQHGQQQVRAQKLQQRQQQLNDQERMLREQAEELETKRALIREERRKHEEEMVIVTQKRDTLRREQRQLRAEAEEQRLLQDQEAAAAHRRTRDLETQIAREQRLQQQLLLEQQARQGLAPTNGSHVEQAQAEAGIASDDHFQNDSSTSPAAGESTTGTTNAVDHSHVGANPFGIALHPEHQLRSRESAETRARNIM